MIDEKKLIERFKQLKGSDTLANMFISDVIKEIQNQQKADWIPCEERLPSEGTEVLVTIEEIDDCRYTQTSWLQDGQWVVKKTPFNPTVIAWQPKPQPYKKEGAE